MKFKLLTLVLALILTASLIGCGNAENPGDMMSDIESGLNSADDKIKNDVQSDTNTKITEEKAKEIALNKAKLQENEIKNFKIKSDREDDVWVYNIEFDHNDFEYSYEIDANTGNITEQDKDSIYD